MIACSVNQTETISKHLRMYQSVCRWVIVVRVWWELMERSCRELSRSETVKACVHTLFDPIKIWRSHSPENSKKSKIINCSFHCIYYLYFYSTDFLTWIHRCCVPKTTELLTPKLVPFEYKKGKRFFKKGLSRVGKNTFAYWKSFSYSE